ncbi:hypothetical protein U1Q18_020542 [Sarracenia purpurea var. burkii]
MRIVGDLRRSTVVKVVQRPDIQHGGGIGIRCRVDGFEVCSEGFVRGGVLRGVKLGSEGRAVAAGGGDDVRGVEVLGGKGGEEEAGVV